MNPPSIVLGGGVHGRSCWLIAYKACGVDGLAAEHFIYADERIHVILSILFNCFISHGYLPSEFMKTAIVPIIKNKTGDTSDKNNYRPIALVTACLF